MSTNSEGNNSSRAIAINLVNNPRDFFKDAIVRSLSGYKLSNSLVFSAITKFVYKFNRVYKLLKNENKETKNQFPYGMCNAYISDTFVDYALLEKDCIKFVKSQKTEVLEFLNQVDKFLVKAYEDREGEALQDELNTINAMPDDVDPSTAKADALEAFYEKLSNKDKAYMIAKIDSLESAYLLELEIQALLIDPDIKTDPIKKQKLQEKEDLLATLQEDNPDDTILKSLYLDQLKLITESQKDKEKTLSKLSELSNKKYSIIKDTEYLSEEDYQNQLKDIKQQKLQYENKIKEINKKYLELRNVLLIYRIANVSVLALKLYDRDGNPLLIDGKEQGTIPENKEKIAKQESFMEDTFLEISIVDYGLPNPEYFVYNYKNRRYGNSMFWATLMPKPFFERDITYAGISKNRKDISTLKIFFAKRRPVNELNPEVFEEEVYYPNEPTYTVMCHIKKNTSPPQYGVFYLTPDDSPYLTSLLNQESLFKNTNLDKPIEFYPVIPIKELSKDLVDYDPIDIKTTLGFACEELLRNLYINIYGIVKAINKVGKETLEITCKDNSIMAYIKNRYDVYSARTMRPSYSKNDSTSILLNYYESKPDKTNRNSILQTTTDKLIQDVFLALGISADNFDSASAKYLYELFSKLKPECKIDKKKFITYQDHQLNDSYKYLDAYNLENRVSIRNTYFETLLTFNYIEEETLSGKWEYSNPLFTDLTLNYSEIKVVSIPQTKVFQSVYEVWDTPSMTLHGNNSEYYTPWGGIEYDNNILEIYIQISNSAYTKLSIHGLKITYNRRFTYLPEFKKYPEAAQGYYNEDIKDRKYKLETDSTTYSLSYFKFYKDTQKASVTNVTPKENIDLSNFIIPLWHHDITENSYYKKDTNYTVNDVNNVLQKSLNLLVFGTLQDNQKELFPSGNDYFVPVVHRKEIILACLDSFISKFNKFEKFNRYLTNTIDTEDDKDKEAYTDLFYQIATNPNISAYCNIPPTWNKPKYMVGQNKVSYSTSSQLMNNKSSFYFETLSQENKIFGDVKINKFKLRKSNEH